MAVIHQIRVAWTGAIGTPGVSTFYCSGPAASMQASLVTFFTNEKSLIPAAYNITVPNTGTDIDTATGQPSGTWTGGTATTIAGTGAGNYSAPSGACIIWHTGSYLNGRELRGKTFMVPLMATCYATNGTLNDTDRAGMQSDANVLRGSAGTMVVWSRRAGAVATVSSATVADKAAVLRSRRD
jgi:hypothetical protein